MLRYGLKLGLMRMWYGLWLNASASLRPYRSIALGPSSSEAKGPSQPRKPGYWLLWHYQGGTSSKRQHSQGACCGGVMHYRHSVPGSRVHVDPYICHKEANGGRLVAATCPVQWCALLLIRMIGLVLGALAQEALDGGRIALLCRQGELRTHASPCCAAKESCALMHRHDEPPRRAAP